LIKKAEGILRVKRSLGRAGMCWSQPVRVDHMTTFSPFGVKFCKLYFVISAQSAMEIIFMA
jgi:hypothetical protein